MKISLAEEDRQRLGAPEWLDLDLGRFTNWDAIRLATLRGHGDWSDYASFSALAAACDDRAQDFAAYTVLVWLGLARAGVKVPIEELVFSVVGIRTDTGAGDDPGKAPATSTTSDAGTPLS